MTYRTFTAMSALALLAVTAAPVQAQATNEVALHIEASAQVPPDTVVMPVTLVGRGKTEKAALADLAGQERELGQQLGQAGIGKDKITTGPDSKGPVVAFEAPTEDAACAAAAGAAQAADAATDAASDATSAVDAAAAACPAKDPEATARKTLLVNVGDPKKLDLLKSLDVAGIDEGYGRSRPVYSQSDPLAARGKARDLALVKARAEADAYAGAMGYRIVRMVRVSNARPGISMQDLVGFIATIDDRSSRMQPSWFGAVTTETVAIDFVMVPK